MSIIFVHGSGGYGDIWRYQTQYFPDSHAVTLPGHPHGQILSSVEECVDWLRKYIKAREYSDLFLAGHSFGGAIVLLYALRYPQDLKGIIIIGSGARLRVHPTFLTPCEEAIKGNSYQWYQLIQEMYRSTPEDYRKEMVEKQKAIGPAAMLNDFLCCDRFDIMDRVHEIKMPALIIAGESDSKVMIVPQAGHFVFAEKPQVVNKAIEDFVEGTSS